MEEWRKFSNDCSIEVSNLGRVRNTKTKKFLKPNCSHTGYLKVKVYYYSKKRYITKKVHTLVAIAFLGERPQNLIIDHIDGNRTNNRVDNLRWVDIKTNSSNTKKLRRSPVVVCAEGLSDFYQEYDTVAEALPLCKRLRSAVVPIETKDGVWACKTYE